MKKITEINGGDYLRMIAGGVDFLKGREETVNNLNVFPVPDGDTGTNMVSTASGAVSVPDSASVADASAAAATAMMRASRGNSGVILSLYFRGVAKVLAGHATADARLMHEAFRSGSVSAASAVAQPVEGTVLTVMRECLPEKAPSDDIRELVSLMVEKAEEVLAKTPDMLPVLKRARVVDSGGQGFVYILEGMKRALENGEASAYEPEAKTEPAAEKAFLESAEAFDIRFPFCTECLLDRGEDVSDGDIGEFRSWVYGMGDSIVFVSDETMVKIHVHTGKPLDVLSRMAALGTIVKTKIENMRVQHTNFIEKASEGEELELPPQTFELEAAVIAVADGDGLADAFREAGVREIVSGGQSMNPSTDEIISAARACSARTVFVLPNNKNIIMAAQQASKLCELPEIRVIKTRSVPEGIAAALAFNISRNNDENESVMEDAAKDIVTMSFTRAVRNAQVDAFSIKKKQFMGLLGDKIRSVADDVGDAVRGVLSVAQPKDFYTVYYGHGVKEENAEEIAEIIRQTVPDAEVIAVSGGQGVYPFIISAE